MDLSDDNTDVNSEAYKFDLQETLKKIYDPSTSRKVRIRTVHPSERIPKKHGPRKIIFAFENPEDEETFKENKRTVQNDYKDSTSSDDESSESTSHNVAFKIFASSDDFQVTSDTSE